MSWWLLSNLSQFCACGSRAWIMNTALDRGPLVRDHSHCTVALQFRILKPGPVSWVCAPVASKLGAVTSGSQHPPASARQVPVMWMHKLAQQTGALTRSWLDQSDNCAAPSPHFTVDPCGETLPWERASAQVPDLRRGQPRNHWAQCFASGIVHASCQICP